MAASVLLASGVLILLVSGIYVVVVRPRINQWGATDQEHRSTWPGDQLVDRPSFVWTNAITIKAPAAQVWPWLVQLGQGRGGLYSYDWLENLIGCDVHSTDRILPAFQAPLQVGDRVIRMARYAPCNPVALFEPQRALVLGHVKDTYAQLAAGHARSSWAFLLQPLDQDSIRLLVRCRGSSLMARLQGPVQFVMQHKMMLGIKQRAEGNLVASPPAVHPRPAERRSDRGRATLSTSRVSAQLGHEGRKEDDCAGRLWQQAWGHQGHRRAHRRPAPGPRTAGSGSAGRGGRRAGRL